MLSENIKNMIEDCGLEVEDVAHIIEAAMAERFGSPVVECYGAAMTEGQAVAVLQRRINDKKIKIARVFAYHPERLAELVGCFDLETLRAVNVLMTSTKHDDVYARAAIDRVLPDDLDSSVVRARFLMSHGSVPPKSK